MHRVVFLDRGTLPVPLRRPAFAHEWVEHDNTAAVDVVARLQGATVAISNKVPLPREALRAAPTLKLIAVCATGTNNVDLDYCRENGIVVCNVRHYAMHTLPEHVFASMLALRRKLLAFVDDVRAGRWQVSDKFYLGTHEVRDLHGSTLGIVGYGELGATVARLGQAFGMRVLVAERKGAASVRPQRTAFEQVLRESDVVTLHLPLTDETVNLIGAGELASMRRDALLINTARGGLVDEAALVAALREGRIGGAAVDVLTREPPREGNVLLDGDIPNLIVTPHVAWAGREAMGIMGEQLIGNIEAFVRGAPRNLVG
jgi:glycerate dehydrogenase